MEKELETRAYWAKKFPEANDTWGRNHFELGDILVLEAEKGRKIIRWTNTIIAMPDITFMTELSEIVFQGLPKQDIIVKNYAGIGIEITTR